MTTNKWPLIVVVLLIVIALGYTFLADKETSNVSGEVIKIGVVAPRTGGAAGYGEPLSRGVELALADLGKTDNSYKVIYEDDGTNPAQSASAAQKLVNIDKVQALITVSSGTGNAVKPIATAAGVTHVCVCADVRLADNNTNFTYLPLPDKEANAWIQEAKIRGVKKVAIISQNHSGMNLIIDYIKTGLEKEGMKLVYEDRFEPSVKDFKTSIAKAKTSAPDVYILGAFPPSLDVLAQEFSVLGIKNIAGVGTFAISTHPELYEGGWYTDASLTDMAFKDRFEEKFPSVKFNARTAPYGYDALNILVDGFESGDGISVYIKNLLRYEGKIGIATKSADSGSFDAPFGIWEIKGGKVVQIK